MSLRGWVPRWWEGQGGAWGAVADVALAPAELAYRGVVAARNRGFEAGILKVARPPIPTVSVGNVAVGGAGKTPVAAWVAARLRAWGHRPAIALRGYGADEVKVHRELNPEVPVYASARRLAAVADAAAAGCDCAVLDDGFQHRGLARDLDVVLVPVEGWSDHPRLLPRGPWREAPAALRRADVVLVTRKSADEAERDRVLAALEGRLDGAARIAACHLAPTRLRPLHPGRRTRTLGTLNGRSVVAVAALAAPGPFIAQLEATGAVVEPILFTDHHEYTPADVERVRAVCAQRQVVMTLKDAVKLRALLGPEVDAWVLHQTVTMERGEEILDAALRRALEAAHG